jgi:hypothetical protein
MTTFISVYYFPAAHSIITVGAGAIIGFVTGLLVKSGIIAKHKKRILELENEMLSNHSRILDLEQQNGELKTDISELTSRAHGDSKLKAS